MNYTAVEKDVSDSKQKISGKIFHDISVFFLTFSKKMIYYHLRVLHESTVFPGYFSPGKYKKNSAFVAKNVKTVKKYEKKGGFNLTNRIFQYRFTGYDFRGRITYKK